MQNKQAQFIKAVRFIYQNINSPIALEEVAMAASVSLSSLKRLFSEFVEESPGQFIRRLRMELAFKTLQSKELSVIETALSVGYEDHSAFSRRFKQAFGLTPQLARQTHHIMNELEHIELDDPEIVMLHEIQFQAVTEEAGSYFEAAPKAWERLASHIQDKNPDESLALFICVGLDNPHLGQVAPDKLRFSAGVCCVDHSLNIDKKTLPAGSYARFHFRGKPTKLGLAYHYILGKWQQQSEYKIKVDGLIFQMYDHFPEVEAVQSIMICAPLEE